MKTPINVIDLVESDVDRACLSLMRQHSSFTKSKKYLYSLYTLRLSIADEITHMNILGLKDLLIAIGGIKDESLILVTIFLDENKNKSWAVFTDTPKKRFYGLVKGGESVEPL